MRYRFVISACLVVLASTWLHAAPPVQDLYLGMGVYPSEKNIAFYTPADYEDPLEIQLSPSNELINGEFPTSSPRFAASSKITYTLHRAHKATINGLQANTRYSYRIGSDTAGWSATHEFNTANDNTFNFIVAGDPQIGAVGFGEATYAQAINQGANWQRIMSQAFNLYPDASFFIAPGDVVQRPKESYFKALLNQEVIRTRPSVMLEASHDDDDYEKNESIFHQHIFQPTPSYPATNAKGFFWFKHGDTLFIHADYTYISETDPREYIIQAVEQFPDTKWRIYLLHYSYYAAGFHANASTAAILRQQFSPILDNMGIDLVIFGHDHAYLRTPQLLNDQVVAITPHLGNVPGVLNPEGAVYIQSNSSSGTKYYPLKSDIHQRYYTALARQTNTPSFINIDINDNDLTIKSFEVDGDNNVTLFDQYRIHKTGIRPVLTADYDSDGHANESDAFPYDPTEWQDTDNDGAGDNADTDDDNDGIDDEVDPFPLRAQSTAMIGGAHCPTP